VPLDDHTLLLQLERTYEAVEERITELDKELGDHATTQCDCDCMYHEFVDKDEFNDEAERLQKQVTQLGIDLVYLKGFVESLQDRIRVLEAR